VVEELRESVLQQGESPRLRRDVGHDVGDQSRIYVETHPLRGAHHRPVKLLGRERRHSKGARLHQLGQADIAKWAVVEVRPKRQEDAQAARGIGRSGEEDTEESGSNILGVHQREELLELVDHQEEN
jgi:hypothetical protein